MAQQTNYINFPSGGSKRLSVFTENMSWVPRNSERTSIPRGGAAMEWNSSDQSNSTISSDGTYISASSTDSMTFDDIGQYGWTPSIQNEYSNLVGSAPLPLSSPAALPSAQPHSGYQPHATPSSLGWTPKTELWKLYTLVVPKGKEPYLELLPQWTVTAATPPKVFLDPPKKVAPKNKGSKMGQTYPCQFPGGCHRKEEPFTRPADLERHYRCVHSPPNEDDSYYCDYPNCPRSTDAFSRKDHFRDHLREYHKEDIGSAKGEKQTRDRAKWLKKQEQWLQERRCYPSWWRCASCLCRVHVAEEGWECPHCRKACEPERKRARAAKAAAPQQQSTSLTATPLTCVVCNGSGWDGYVACSYCDVSGEPKQKEAKVSDAATGQASSSSKATSAGPVCGICNDTAWVQEMDSYLACPSCQPDQGVSDYTVTQWPTTNPYSGNWGYP